MDALTPTTWNRAAIRARVREGKSMKGLKFTKQNLDELKPAEKEYFAWSSDLPGFGVRVLPSGKKSWLVQFRIGDGRSIRKTIGSTRVVPLSMATERAQTLLAHAKVHGIDLAAQEKVDALARLKRRDSRLGSIIGAYLAEPETKAKKSFGEIERYLVSVWAPVHDLDAETASRHDLIPTLRRIATERGSTTANRAKASLSSCITWAIRHGLLRRDNSPTAYLPAWLEQARERALSLEELGRIWQAAPLVHEQFGRMLRLLILTGCRRSEISDLSWQEVDFGRGVIELPGSRTKNGLPLVVPLPPAALAILAGVPRMSTSAVFIGFRPWSHAKAKLDDMLGLAPWVIHDLRRSVSTGLHEHLNADTHLIELCLNHASGSRGAIAGVYDRSQRLAERRDLLTGWSALILEAAGEPPAPAAENVVSLGRAR
jgi:integrase